MSLLGLHVCTTIVWDLVSTAVKYHQTFVRGLTSGYWPWLHAYLNRVADIAVVVRLEAFLLFLLCLKRVLRKRGTFRHFLQLYQKQLTCTQRLLLLCPFSEQLTVKVAHLWTFDDSDIWSTGACHKKIRLGFKRENILNEQ